MIKYVNFMRGIVFISVSLSTLISKGAERTFSRALGAYKYCVEEQPSFWKGSVQGAVPCLGAVGVLGGLYSYLNRSKKPTIVDRYIAPIASGLCLASALCCVARGTRQLAQHENMKDLSWLQRYWAASRLTTYHFMGLSELDDYRASDEELDDDEELQSKDDESPILRALGAYEECVEEQPSFWKGSVQSAVPCLGAVGVLGGLYSYLNRSKKPTIVDRYIAPIASGLCLASALCCVARGTRQLAQHENMKDLSWLQRYWAASRLTTYHFMGLSALDGYRNNPRLDQSAEVRAEEEVSKFEIGDLVCWHESQPTEYGVITGIIRGEFNERCFAIDDGSNNQSPRIILSKSNFRRIREYSREKNEPRWQQGQRVYTKTDDRFLGYMVGTIRKSKPRKYIVSSGLKNSMKVVEADQIKTRMNEPCLIEDLIPCYNLRAARKCGQCWLSHECTSLEQCAKFIDSLGSVDLVRDSQKLQNYSDSEEKVAANTLQSAQFKTGDLVAYHGDDSWTEYSDSCGVITKIDGPKITFRHPDNCETEGPEDHFQVIRSHASENETLTWKHGQIVCSKKLYKGQRRTGYIVGVIQDNNAKNLCYIVYNTRLKITYRMKPEDITFGVTVCTTATLLGHENARSMGLLGN